MTFMDFCSGIGGGRLGLERNGLRCVGHSEISGASDKTYRLFFGGKESNYGDLMEIDPDKLPHFDMMIAGFPCQTFSIAGKRAGFEDDRGTVIYGLIKLLRAREVSCFLLENVKGLVNHDRGRTFAIILAELAKVGYEVYHSVLNSQDFGVPQMRERIYLVGFKKELGVEAFSFPTSAPISYRLSDILVPEGGEEPFDEQGDTFRRYLHNKYNEGRYTFADLVGEDYMVVDTRHSDLRIYRGATPTLRTGRHGILYAYGGRLWRLTGTQALLLQGFGREHVALIKESPVVSNNTLLSQAGNAMTVNVIESISKSMLEALSITLKNKESVCL